MCAPVASPPAWTTARGRVGALAGRGSARAAVAVEARRRGASEVGDLGRPLRADPAPRPDVAEPGAGGERVGEVGARPSRPAVHRGGDAALGAAGAAVLEIALGDQDHGASARRAQGQEAAGGAAADDDQRGRGGETLKGARGIHVDRTITPGRVFVTSTRNACDRSRRLGPRGPAGIRRSEDRATSASWPAPAKRVGSGGPSADRGWGGTGGRRDRGKGRRDRRGAVTAREDRVTATRWERC